MTDMPGIKILLLCLLAFTLAIGCGEKQAKPGKNDPDFLKAEQIISTLSGNNRLWPNIQRLHALLNGDAAKDHASIDTKMELTQDDVFAQAGYICLDARYLTADDTVSKNLKETASKFFEKSVYKNPANAKAAIGRAWIDNADITPETLLSIYKKITALNAAKSQCRKGTEFEKRCVYLYWIDVARHTSTLSGSRVAEKILDHALAQYPDVLAVILKAAQVHFALKHFEKSRVFALQALDLNKEAPDPVIEKQCNYILAEVNLHEGDFEQPEEFFKKAAVREDGTHWECAYQALGRIYRNTGHPTKAAGADMKASDLRPNNDSLAYRAALTCFSIGNHECAMKYVDRALSAVTKAEYSYLKSYVLLFSEQYDKAEKIFSSLGDQPDMESALQIAKGHLALIQNDLVGAFEYFERVVSDTIGGPKSFVNEMGCLGMGWALANRNEHAKALPYFDKYLAQQPKGIFGLLGKANSLVGSGQIEQGEKLLEEVLGIQPDNPNALAELAMIYFYRGDNEKAEKYLKNAMKAGDFRQTCPYEGLGLLYLKQGKMSEAKKNLKKAIDLNPSVEYKKFNALAEIYIREGKIEKAKNLLKKSIANYPYDPKAQEMLNKLSGHLPETSE